MGMKNGFVKGIGLGMMTGAAAAVMLCSGLESRGRAKSGLGRCFRTIGEIVESLARAMGV